jgi:two-component system, OmpR family, sensor histidine kinase KdpD
MATFRKSRFPVRNLLIRSARIVLSVGVVGLVLALGSFLRHVNVTTTALVLVLAVLGIALVWDWLDALVAAVAAGLGLDFFFLPPAGFGIEDIQHWVALFAFLATALATGQLSARVRRQRSEAVRRRIDSEKLQRFSDALSEYESAETVVQRLAGTLLENLGVEAAAVYDKANDRIWRSGAGSERIADGQLREAAASGNRFVSPDSFLDILPIHKSGELAGSMGIAGTGVSPLLLVAVAEKVGNAIEKVHRAEIVKEAEIARRADELRCAVLDELAHEATGPLGTIEMAATTLLSDRPGDSDQQREMLTVIREEVDRLYRWIAETVRVSHAGESQLTLDKAPQDIRHLVASALETLGPRASGRRVSVEFANAPPTAHCDADIIRRVIHLLLDNAMKYSPPGSPIFITSALDHDTGRVVLSIADAGPGVPADEQAHIFEKHYRGSRHKASVPGMGLGLASARYLVELHGGEIWVTNRPGGGAAFQFSLPTGDGVAV